MEGIVAVGLPLCHLVVFFDDGHEALILSKLRSEGNHGSGAPSHGAPRPCVVGVPSIVFKVRYLAIGLRRLEEAIDGGFVQLGQVNVSVYSSRSDIRAFGIQLLDTLLSRKIRADCNNGAIL